MYGNGEEKIQLAKNLMDILALHTAESETGNLAKSTWLDHSIVVGLS